MAGRPTKIIHHNPEAFSLLTQNHPQFFHLVIVPFFNNAIAGTCARLSRAVKWDAIKRRSVQFEKVEKKAKAYGVVPRTKHIIKLMHALKQAQSMSVADIQANCGVCKNTALQVTRLFIEGDFQARIVSSFGKFIAPVRPLELSEEEAARIPF